MKATVGNAVIDEMVARLVGRFRPLRVILFGSWARGDAAQDSDVDLLVIMPNGTQTRKAAIAMMSALRDADAAKDVVVATPKTLERFGDSPGMVYGSALREGRVLYER